MDEGAGACDELGVEAGVELEAGTEAGVELGTGPETTDEDEGWLAEACTFSLSNASETIAIKTGNQLTQIHRLHCLAYSIRRQYSWQSVHISQPKYCRL